MRRTRTLISVAFLIGIALAIYSTLRPLPRDRAPAAAVDRGSLPTEESVSEEPVAPRTESMDRLHGDRWPAEGERWTFRFERKIGAEYQGKTWLSMKFGGRASIEPAGSHGENRFYLFSFVSDRFEMQGKIHPGSRVFPSIRAEITPTGALRELRFVEPDSAPTEMKDAVKDLVAQWFFFEAETRLGKAEAKFELLRSEPGEEAYSKTIVRYPARAEITRLDSTHEWASVLDSNSGSRVARIEGTENFTVGGGTHGDFEQRTSYRWVWIQTERVTKMAQIDVGRAVRISDEAAATDSASPSKHHIARAVFRSEFSRIGKMGSHARLAFFEKARKALDAGQSELVADIVSGVKGRSVTSLEWRSGVGMLAASSNETAQKALVDLYRNVAQTEEKLSILAGVSAGEGKPAPEWKDVFSSELASTAQDSNSAVREASTYALGSAIRKETNEERRRELEGVLWKEISDASTPKARVTVLEAIGNSGSREFYPYVQAQAQAAEAQVRAKAVGAVRFLASELARPIIDTAKDDPSPVVRKAAAWSRRYVEAGAPDSP